MASKSPLPIDSYGLIASILATPTYQGSHALDSSNKLEIYTWYAGAG